MLNGAVEDCWGSDSTCVFSLKISETSEGKSTKALLGAMFEKSVGALEFRETLVSGVGVLDGSARGEGNRDI